MKLGRGWVAEAACLDLTWMASPGRTQEAREVCARCPVFDECREYALSPEGRSVPGVMGGLTQAQRNGVTCSSCGHDVDPARIRAGVCWSCYRKNQRRAARGAA